MILKTKQTGIPFNQIIMKKLDYKNFIQTINISEVADINSKKSC